MFLEYTVTVDALCRRCLHSLGYEAPPPVFQCVSRHLTSRAHPARYQGLHVVQHDSIKNAPPRGTGEGDAASLIVGTRGSALALHQAHYVADRLASAHPDVQVRVQVISSEGDVDKESPLTRIGGRGVFTSSLQKALTLGEVDVAVHSSKDVPSISAVGLTLAAFPQREDPRDVVVSRHNLPLEELPANPVVGTSSRRRAAQVLAIRPDAEIVDLRGNIDTRLRKSSAEPYDAVILAAAGLARMGWIDRATSILPVDRFTPAPGQGALAIETRTAPDPAHDIVAGLDDPRIRQALEVERSFLRGIGGGCTTPLGAHATIETLHGQSIARFHAMLARDDGEGLVRIYEEWPVSVAVDAAFEVARALVREVHPNRVFGAGREQARQLRGMRIIITGTDDLVNRLTTEVARRGGEPVIVPTIRIRPPDDPEPLRDALLALQTGGFDHLVLTSRHGVEAIANSLQAMPPGSARVAAIGDATAAAIRELGVEPATVSSDASQEGVLEALRPSVAPDDRVLLPVSNRARPALADGLRACGAEVVRVDAYTTEVITDIAPELLALVETGGVGAVMLASPSAVEGLVAQLGSLLPAMSGAGFVAIGRVTADAMVARGLPVHAMPVSPGATEMVDALADYLWGGDAIDGDRSPAKKE